MGCSLQCQGQGQTKHACTHTHTHTHARMHTRTHTDTHRHNHTNIDSHTHTQTGTITVGGGKRGYLHTRTDTHTFSSNKDTSNTFICYFLCLSADGIFTSRSHFVSNFSYPKLNTTMCNFPHLFCTVSCKTVQHLLG